MKLLPLLLRGFLSFFICILLVSFFSQQDTYGQSSFGTITGKVTDAESQEPLPNVNVQIKGTSLGTTTDADGRFQIGNIPAGTHVLKISVVGYRTVERSVTFATGETLERDFAMLSSDVQVGEVLVVGASLRPERITEAPSSVSVIESKDIARYASHNQLPKLLDSQPGVDVVQSGLFDFNINTRGFNSSLNRRVLILLDGRDLGTAFLGATEWSGLSTPLEQLGRIELVRGPGSALYGANAYNGVINITSLSPRDITGTNVSATVGEFNAQRYDVRHAEVINDEFSFKINAGGYQGKTTSKSRLTPQSFEYKMNELLNVEVREINPGPVSSLYFSGRLDYDISPSERATFESGLTETRNELIVTGIGRVQVQQARNPWFRLNYSGHGLNAMVYSNNRVNVKPEVSLSTNLDLYQNASINHAEAQYSYPVEDDLFIVGGASYRHISVDTKGTLMQDPRSDYTSGFFGQVEWKYMPSLKFVGAMRYDFGSQYTPQFSPKLATVWTPTDGHSIRLTFNKAFQAPNYSERFLYVKHPTKALIYLGYMTEPDDIKGFQGPENVIPYPIKPVKELEVEKITGYELGYSGIFTHSFHFTFDSYFNILSDFVTDLTVGVNPRFLQRGYFDIPRTIWSYGSAGRVQEWGFETGMNYYVGRSVKLEANYSLFRFEVLEKDKNDFLLPNAPAWRANAGVTYVFSDQGDVAVRIRYVPTYEWAAGIYNNSVIPAYAVVDFTSSYEIMNNATLSLNVANLLDRRHYEILGGSVLRRRSLFSVSYSF